MACPGAVRLGPDKRSGNHSVSVAAAVFRCLDRLTLVC